MSADETDEAALAAALAAGRVEDPFAALGPHLVDGRLRLRVFQPGALGVEAAPAGGEPVRLEPVGGTGLFAGTLAEPSAYVLRIAWPDAVQETEDPYAFGPVLGELDLHLFAEGRHLELWRRFGAQPLRHEGVEGVAFAVWAPRAQRVSVIGDFNGWDGRRHVMRRRGSGVFELFAPRLRAGERYKFEVLAPDGRRLEKADPVARATERPPKTASVVAAPADYAFHDGAWLAERAAADPARRPVSVYEVHAASWVRPQGDAEGVLDWEGLGRRLVPYAADMGFTHIELLPVMEHPFGGSWGYQPLSQFAPSARFGPPEAFAAFVDLCHARGLGVILDWVPAHFPTDAHGLAAFDGAPVYEYADPREGFHRDWNSLIYDFGRPEVQGFLISSALFWLEAFHVDALRVDAVASMLYRDYSRGPGEWVPNRHGGRENLEAVDFLRRLNEVVAARVPGALLIAEESTAWPGVTAPVREGGLGFGFKWNMGWMHDTLSYMALDPVHRAWHHDQMTFGMVYAFSERFLLPLSHDEVVYGKGSMIGKMPGDPWRRFANLRVYYAFMFAHPGKKLLFMGDEIAQPGEWNHDGEVDWGALADPAHRGVQRLVRDLNRLYAAEPALHAGDADPRGFAWLVADDRVNSVFAFLRREPEGEALVLFVGNFTPVPREDYRIGVPAAGRWRVLLNTDAEVYGGGNVGPGSTVVAEEIGAHGCPASISLRLPPLGGLYLKWEGG